MKINRKEFQHLAASVISEEADENPKIALPLVLVGAVIADKIENKLFENCDEIEFEEE